MNGIVQGIPLNPLKATLNVGTPPGQEGI